MEKSFLQYPKVFFTSAVLRRFQLSMIFSDFPLVKLQTKPNFTESFAC